MGNRLFCLSRRPPSPRALRCALLSYIALVTPLAAELGGPLHLAQTSGLLYSLTGIGTLLGPPLAGLWYQASGSYDGAYAACCASMLMSAALMMRTFERH